MIIESSSKECRTSPNLFFSYGGTYRIVYSEYLPIYISVGTYLLRFISIDMRYFYFFLFCILIRLYCITLCELFIYVFILTKLCTILYILLHRILLRAPWLYIKYYFNQPIFSVYNFFVYNYAPQGAVGR